MSEDPTTYATAQKRHIKDTISPKTGIHCPTLAEWLQIRLLLENHGIEIPKKFWNDWGEDFVCLVVERDATSTGWAENNGYTVYPASDFLPVGSATEAPAYDVKYMAAPPEPKAQRATGIELIANERNEQIRKHLISVESDRVNNPNCQLAEAAAKLIAEDSDWGFEAPYGWDFDRFDKMRGKSYNDRLVIAGALIAAELDRLNSL